MSWLHSYWSWAGSNIGAMPAEALITAVATVLLWPLLRRALAWLKRELGGEALEEAKAARRIAADLFEHHVGRPHPDAPGQFRTPADVPDSGSEAE